MASRQSAAVIGPERFRAPASSPGATGRSLLAGLALLLVVVGLPILLLTTLGLPPIPTDLSLSVLTRAVSVDALLGVLVWVVWLAWLQFTACTAVELVSALRGDDVPGHLPLSGGMQSLVRRLVITALLITSASTPAVAAPAAAPPTPAPTATAAAVEAPRGDAAPVPGSGSSADSAAGPVTSRLEDQDSRLPQGPQVSQDPQSSQGSGDTGTVVGNVTYKLGDTVLDPEIGAQLVGQRVYVVQPPQGHYHDNLWDIAERTLGDGRAYQQIYDLNAGRTQPDGRSLELARLIQPNWYLIMPESATDVPRVEAVTTLAPPAPAPEPEPTGGEQQQAPPAQRIDDVLPADLPAFGAITAASVLALLTRRRRYGSWRFPDSDAGELERLLRVGADPERAGRLDTALRSLSDLAAPPEPYAAGVDDSAVILFLTRGVPEAPAPWRTRKEGRIWELPREADVRAPAEPARVGTGLVTLGRDERGTDVLIDLSMVDGDVAVGGAPSLAAEIVSALALELCTNPWSARVRVTGVGLPSALHSLCGARLEAAPDIAGAVGGSGAAGAAGAASDGGAPSPAEVLTGRRGGVGAGNSDNGYNNHIVLAVSQEVVPPAPVGGRGVALVRTGGGNARWRIEVDSSGGARVEPLDVAVRVTRATEADLEALGELFADPVAGGRPPVPEPPSPPSAAALRSAPVRVQVLGPAVVVAPGAVDPERLPLLTEEVACLALHREGLHPRVLGSMIWPLGVTGDVVAASIDRLRSWLGRDETGADHLREDAEGRLTLAPDVAVDWDVLRGLLAAARRAEARGGDEEELRLLQEALRLVRGPVCQGADQGRYGWLARLRTTHESEELITDAAHRVAVLLGDDDPDGAAGAIAVGLQVVDLDQRLWRDDLRLAAASGQDRLAARVNALLDLSGADDLRRVDPRTAALVEELAPGRGLGVRRRPA